MSERVPVLIGAAESRLMTRIETLYWRTHAGLQAWICADSGLPPHYRRILGAMQCPVTVEALRRALGACSTRQLAAWLDELETLGFIETGSAAAACYGKAA
jgi:hypothetical protein